MRSPRLDERFVPPQDEAEAERMRADLEITIADIEIQIEQGESRSRQVPFGRARSDEPAWLEKAKAAKRRYQARLTWLAKWSERQKPKQELPEKRLHDLLGETYRLLLSLQGRGITFAANEAKLMKRIHEIFPSLKAHSSTAGACALDVARSCRKGSPEFFARVGEAILTASHDPQDLDALRQALKATSKPEGRLQIGCAVIRGCAHFGLLDEASAVALALPVAGSEARLVEAWCEIAKASGHDAHWRHAVRIAGNLPPGDRCVAWCTLLGASHDLSYGVKAKQALDEIGRDTKSAVRIPMLQRLLVINLLKAGRIMAARSLAEEIDGGEARCQAYVAIAMESRDAGDVEEAVRLMRAQGLRTKFRLIADLAEACVLCRCPESAVGLARDLTPAGRCIVYAHMTAHATGAQRMETLEIVRVEVRRIAVTDAGEPYALYAYVRALMAAGLLDEAEKVAISISHPEYCCRACLLVHEAREKLKNSEA